MLGFTFFMVIGFEMIMPLVVGQYVGIKGFSATSVATTLALRRFFQQGLSPVSGFFADRLSIKKMIAVGVLLRAVGFMLLANDSSYLSLVAAMIVIGLGGALFDVPLQTAIGKCTTDENRTGYYSLNNTITGIGTALGPLVGALLLNIDFKLVCVGAALCFVVNFIITLFTLPDRIQSKSQQMATGFFDVFNNKVFRLFICVMIIFWLAAAQIDITYPLRIQNITGKESSISVMYFIYALVTMLLQIPLIALLKRHMGNIEIVLIGMVVMGLSFVVTAVTDSPLFFYFSVGLFAVGMLLARPSQQAIVVELSKGKHLGTYLGISSLSTAIGCGVGTIIGGRCYDFSNFIGNSQYQWYLYVLVSLIAFIGFLLVKIKRR